MQFQVAEFCWHWAMAGSLYVGGVLSRLCTLLFPIFFHWTCNPITNAHSQGAAGPWEEVAYVAEQWPLQQSGTVAHECLGLTQYWCQHHCHCQMPWQRAGPQS